METDDGRSLRSEVGRMRTEGGEGRDTERCGDPKIWFPMRVTFLEIPSPLCLKGLHLSLYPSPQTRGKLITDRNRPSSRFWYVSRSLCPIGVKHEGFIGISDEGVIEGTSRILVLIQTLL